MKKIGAQVFQVQENVVLILADAPAFADFDGHGTANHVAAGQVLGRRRVAFHEAFAFGIGQVTAFATRPFGDQAAGAIDAGGVELDEFVILQGQPGAGDHAVAVAGAGMGRGAGKIGAPVTACRQHHQMGVETVNGAVVQVPGDDALAFPVLVHDQVDGEVFDEEFGVLFQALLVKRVQHGMAGPVGGGAGALHGGLAEITHMAAEGPLIDFTLGRA